MATAKPRPGIGNKSPSLSEDLIAYTRRGVFIIQKWPRKRGKPTHPTTIEQNKWFSQANTLAKYASAQDQWMAHRITQDLPIYPRDVLISAMAGRLFERLTIDGQEHYSMAVLEDISADLDLLGGTRPGNLMMRGTSLWEALVPGSAGQVLTSNGPDNEASYQPGAGVAAASWTSQQGTDGQSATAAASKGLMIQPTVPIIIYAVGTTGALTSGHSYRVQILDMGTGVIVQSIKAISQSYTMPTPNLGFFSLNFIVPPTLTPDRRWYISCARVDGANNFAVPFHIASTNGWIPGIPSQRIAVSPFWQVPGHIVKRIPTGGDTLITAGAERINMSLLVAA